MMRTGNASAAILHGKAMAAMVCAYPVAPDQAENTLELSSSMGLCG